MGRITLRPQLEIFNLLNSSVVLSEVQTKGSKRRERGDKVQANIAGLCE